MLKKIAIVFGVVFLLVGILGFIPGVTTDDNLLLGLFHVNAIHNVIHLLSGVVALAAGLSTYKSSKTYFQVFGVVYALVTVLGFISMDSDILGLVANNMADNILHVVIAAAALYLGFAYNEEEMAA
jgi:hypothetical protein